MSGASAAVSRLLALWLDGAAIDQASGVVTHDELARSALEERFVPADCSAAWRSYTLHEDGNAGRLLAIAKAGSIEISSVSDFEIDVLAAEPEGQQRLVIGRAEYSPRREAGLDFRESELHAIYARFIARTGLPNHAAEEVMALGGSVVSAREMAWLRAFHHTFEDLLAAFPESPADSIAPPAVN